jgi:Cu(I)/Ag(I) efflux system membrane fusion protein
VESLPKARVVQTAVASDATQKLLAVPRSAVIDTGKRKIVYVQSSEGVFDMKQIQTGPLAEGDYYPVLAGLNEGDQVVTRGAFLIDAENRLNPGM